MSRKLLLVIGQFLIIWSSFASDCRQRYHILSDLDDTIKTYKSKNLKDQINEALIGTTINAGFNNLLLGLVKNSIDTQIEECSNDLFTILSGAPFFLKKSVEHLLYEHDFPSADIILRSSVEDLYEYKIKHVQNVSTTLNLPMVLVGDDLGKDPEVYQAFQSSSPKSVLAIYIHNVDNREVLPGQISYITSFEIAIREYWAGRLTKDEAVNVGLSVLLAKDDEIIPPYGYCPTTFKLLKNSFPLTTSIKINSLSKQIKTRIVFLCNKRYFL